MISAKSKRRLLQIIPFGIIFMVFGIVYSLMEQGILGDYPTYPSTGNPYHFNPVSTALLTLFSGLMIGSIEVIFLNKSFRKNTFLAKIIYKTMIYMLMITAFTFIISVGEHAYELKSSPLDQRVMSYALNFFNHFAFWTIEIYITLGISFCLFYNEVSDNIGQGVLINFFTGKYHHPIEEQRIFMFLDMKDSTTIAEALGHVRYFEMLKEYYSDLTDPIIEFGGEIYQYIGDEIVVTWKQEPGIRNNNCLHCFFAMKASLSNQSSKYKSTYGLVPTFKAGLHLGKVTTGEIGVIRREIAFTGDVLNTTARIQGLCNTYGVDLLTSERLTLALDLGSEFRSQAIEEVELRGRNEKVNLFTIEKTTENKP